MKTQLLNSLKAVTATALISGGIAFSFPAAAITTQGDTITTKIDIRDLETDRGIQRVYEALERRAENACTTPGSKPIEMRLAEQDCTEKLLIDFVQDVDNESLTRYYEKMHS